MVQDTPGERVRLKILYFRVKTKTRGIRVPHRFTTDKIFQTCLYPRLTNRYLSVHVHVLSGLRISLSVPVFLSLFSTSGT